MSYWSKVAVIVIGVVVAVRMLAVLQNILLIAAAAFVIAMGLQPAIRKLENRGRKRGTAMALIIMACLVVVAGIGFALVPIVVDQTASAFDRIPDLWAELKARSDALGDLASRFDATESTLFDPGALALGAAQALLVGLFTVVTLLLLTPYFAVSFPALKAGIFRLLRRDHREDFIFAVNQAIDLTSNYVVGNLIISLTAGVVTFVGLSLIGVPFPLALATWVALTGLIPGVGVVLGAIPVTLVAGQTGSRELLWSLVLIAGYQLVENFVLVPRVMKRAVNLNPALVILALLVGGSLAGLFGALLALPIAALSKVLVTEFLIRTRVETIRDQPESTEPKKRRSRRRIGTRPLP